MRMLGEDGHSLSTKQLSVNSGGEVLLCLLDGLDRMRPELGTLADELIDLLGGADAITQESQEA